MKIFSGAAAIHFGCWHCMYSLSSKLSKSGAPMKRLDRTSDSVGTTDLKTALSETQISQRQDSVSTSCVHPSPQFDANEGND